MRPARQGSLDGLCGVYAVVNTLDLVGAPSHRSVQRELFQQLTYALGAASLLSAMNEGMDPLTLERAANLAFGWFGATYGVALQAELPFHGRRFRSTAGFLRALRPLVGAPDTSVIIAFKARSRGHWTVVRGMDGPDLLLRDSDGLTVLRTAGFQVGQGRRCLWTGDTMTVRRIDGE